jgi:flagellar basal-body rod protein FlgG
MLRILWNSRSAMIANQEKLDSISNNLANVNTDGYKRVEVSFQDLMYESLDRTGYPVTDNPNRANAPFTGTGVKTGEWVRDNRQGSLTETNKISDLAIDGEGYFMVTMPNGTEAYTRAGRFNVDSLGRLVDGRGNFLNIIYNEGVEPSSVTFTNNNFAVNETGELLLREDGGYRPVGRIPIFSASGTNAFISIGESMYVASEETQIYEVTKSSIMQGFVENSNVDMVTEMTEMLLTQRAFELGSRGIRVADEMWGMANNLKGR